MRLTKAEKAIPEATVDVPDSSQFAVGIEGQRILPYMGVDFMRRKTVKVGRKNRHFLVITYRAYNAMGLIGSECNGIAVLDMDSRSVVCDEIERVGSGWYGPTKSQLNLYRKVLKMDSNEFRQLVNSHPRHRYTI